MKVESIKFNNHEVFNNLEIDFNDKNREILSTIVIIGENGSRKTTLLKSIYDSFSNINYNNCEKINFKSTIIKVLRGEQFNNIN